MRAVIAAQSWPRPTVGDLAPAAAVRIVRDAWSAAAAHVDLDVVAVPDGGPRTADALAGEAVPVGGATAMRMDGAVVLAPAGGARWEPSALSSALLGLAAAGETSRVVVPLGDEPPAGDAVDLWGGGLEAARAGVATLDIVALVGSDRPLLGFTGMSAAVRDGREHDAALAQAAQAQEERWAAIAREADPVASRRALLGPTRLSDEPGTGAAGGLAYALAAMGARLLPAAAATAELAGLDRAAASADLVVAVVDRLDARGLDHGLVSAASSLAARRGVPCVAVTAHLAVGKRDLMAAGVAAAHEAAPGEDALGDQIRRVAHTWTPRR
ncbi:glycerate kinase [Demequina sp. SYSU T00192]|uniref:Glycerate kinase n=1 Tax=Demequina litoralis TaxID=3051660 RepID=A0ABT8G6C2_9MICO|nr:glycerate kinase [Demequina sp. SYSU T00192]MDN4474612.1 glycerate kinase [Demequina sp. SYSU T00192]